MADCGYYQLYCHINSNRSYTGQYKHYFKAMAAALIPALEPFVPPSKRRQVAALPAPTAAAAPGGGAGGAGAAGSGGKGAKAEEEEEEEEVDEGLIMLQLTTQLYKAGHLGAPGANPRDL
jgi:hypothetical protein